MKEKIEEIKEHNIKLYKFYKPFAWDLLFYYAISFLFLTDIKGFTASQILFVDAFFPLFKSFLHIVCTVLIEKLGKRRCLIFGNINLAIYLLFIMGGESVPLLILANFFFAISDVLKSLCESNILYDSIEKTRKRNEIFSKIDGSASSKHYYLSVITSAITGFLFVIDPYLPMTISLFITIFCILLSYNFKEIPEEITENTHKRKPKTTLKELSISLKNTKKAFKFIISSQRLRSLIMFNALLYSLMFICINSRRSLMSDIGISSENFGIILAILGLIAGFASSRAASLKKVHKNHTLEFLGNIYIASFIISGLVVALNLPPFVMYFIVLSLFALQYAVEGPYVTIMTSYLNSFSTSAMRIKINSANYLIEGLTSCVFSLITSFLLDITSTAITQIILGLGSFILLIIILNYMKDKVGLNPEDYSEKEIKYNEVV